MELMSSIASRIVELEAEMGSIKNAVETEKRLLTADEESSLEKAQSEHSQLTKQARLLNGVGSAKASTSEPQRKVAAFGAARVNEKSFPTAGHFMAAVKSAKNNQATHERLMNAVSTYGSEGTDADGGYALPDDIRSDIQSFLYSPNSLLSYVDKVPTFSHVLTFPVDVSQPWDTTLSGSWLGEAGAYNESKIAMSTISVTVGKVGTIVNVTEELAQDVAAMGSFVTKKAGARLDYLINTAILSGSGAANNLTGILNSGNAAKKVIAKETGQVAATVVNQNLLKMYYGMQAADRANGTWIISDSAEYALATSFFSGSTLMSKAGDVTNPLGNTIFGRPVVVMPQLAALGTEADILFVNLAKYLAVVKGGVNGQTTPYYYWNQDIQSFKVNVRMGGKPWEAAVRTLPDSTTRSPYVILGAR
jgi:HK97 family phage major capsid protein